MIRLEVGGFRKDLLAVACDGLPDGSLKYDLGVGYGTSDWPVVENIIVFLTFK